MDHADSGLAAPETQSQKVRAGKIGEPVIGDRYIHIRVRNVPRSTRIRTIQFEDGILARIGFGDSGSQVVSLLFDKTMWTPERARAWWQEHERSLAAVASIHIQPELLAPTDSYGFAVPEPTPSKAYAVFRLLSFYPVVNSRHDTFAEDDVGDAWRTIIGSPIYANEDFSDHFTRSGKRGIQVGAVIDARAVPADGIYALAAFYKDVLARYGVDAADLSRDFSVSMEARFDASTVRYRKDGRVYSRDEAVMAGIASADPTCDDPRRYDARFLAPIEYHAVALLRRGRNADPSADVLLAVAADHPLLEALRLLDRALALSQLPKGSEDSSAYENVRHLLLRVRDLLGQMEDHSMDEIEWHADDFHAATQSLGAQLNAEELARLPKSSFAYVDEHGRGKLPIHDAAHVRNALARLNQADIPEAAKRRALRRILRAAKRFGVEVDPNSAVMKAYGALHQCPAAERARLLRALRERRPADAKASGDPHIVTIDGLTALYVDGDVLYRAELDIDDDGEVTVAAVSAYGPILRSKEYSMTDPEIAEAIRAAVAQKETELMTTFAAREAEIAKAAIDQFRASEDFRAAVAQAVDAYKASDEFKRFLDEVRSDAVAQHTKTLETIAARLRELESIHPFRDDTERQAATTELTQTVGDEVAWLRIKSKRLEAALASVSRKVQGTQSRAVPTLVAAGAARPHNPFDLTDEGGA